MRVLLTVLFTSLLSLAAANAQTISGPATPPVGVDVEYTFDNGNIVVNPGWTVTNGSVVSTSSSSTTYTAVINFTALGSATVTFKSGPFIVNSKTVDVVCMDVAAPVSTFTYTYSCTSAVITRAANPPAGYTWYWQTSAGGTSTSLGSGATYTANTSGTYYLRARHNTHTTCWGPELATAALTLGNTPAVPTANDAARCGTGTVALTATPAAGTTARWYAAATGGSPLATANSYTTPSISATTLYYVSSYNTTTTCESSRISVSATVNPAPVGGSVSPTTIISTGSNSGTLTLSAHTGTVLRWERNSSGSWTTMPMEGGSYTNTMGYANVTQNTDFRAVVEVAGCGTANSAISEACVMPATPAVTPGEVCVSGTVVLSGTPPAGATLRWYNVSSGGSILATTNSYTTPTISSTTTYYVSAVSINGAAVCESARVAVVATVSPASAGGSVSPATIQSTGSNSGTITLSGHAGGVMRWEKYEGSSWATISNTTTTQVYNSVTLATDYRAVVKSGSCAEATSSVSELCVLPATPAATPGEVCVSGTVTLSATASGGATLRWYNVASGGSVLTTNNSYTTPTISATTTYYVSAVSTNGAAVCESARVAVVATVSPASAGGTVSPATIQSTGSNSGTITLSGHTGSVVRWEKHEGSSWASISNTTTTQAYNSVTLATDYRAVTKSGSCAEAYSAISEVCVMPAAPVTTGATRCDAGTVTLTANTPPAGVTLRWYAASSGGSVLTTGTSYVPSVSTTTTYYVSAMTSNGAAVCETARTPVTATVSPATVGGTLSPTTLQSTGSNSGTITLSGHTGSVVRWEKDDSGSWTTISNTTTSQAYNSVTSPTDYRAVVKSGVCAEAYSAVTELCVMPAAPTTTGATRCDAGTVTLTANTPPAGVTLRWYAASSGGSVLATGTSYAPSVSTTTTYYVSAMTSNGTAVCETSRTPVTATVSPATAGGTLSPTTIQSTGSNSGTISLSGHTGSVVRWEKYEGSSWTTISNTTTSQPYGSVTLPTDYRAVVKSGVCAEGYSAVTELCVIPATPTTTPGEVCASGTVVLSGTPPAGATLRWYTVSSGGTVQGTANSFTTPSISATTTYYVSAVNTNGAAVCESARVAVVATVSPASAGGTTSPATIQSTGSNSGTITLSGNTGSVVRWEKHEGSSWATISNTTTTQAYNSVTLPTDYRAVTKSGSCAEAYSSVSDLCVVPAAPAVTPGEVCVSGTVVLSATPPANTTLRWYNVSSGGSVLATTNSYTTPSISTTTTYYVSAVNTNGAAVCEGARSAVVATVSPASAGGAVSPTTIQSTGSNSGTITLSGHAGGVMRWEKYEGSSWATISNTTTSQAYNSVTLATDYRAVTKSGSCAEAYSAIAELCVIPATPGVSGATRCDAGTLVLNATPPGAATVRWYAASSGGPVLATTNAFTTPSISSTTTYYVSAVNTNGAAVCESARVAVVATVSPATVAGTVSPTTIQSTGSNSGTITLSGHTGNVVRWEKDDSGSWTTISNTTATQAYNSVTLATDYRAVVKSGVCAEAYSAVTELCVMPAAPTLSDVSRCGAGTVTLTATTPPAGVTLRWYAASSGGSVLTTGTTYSPSVSTTTTYYVSAMTSNGAAVCETTRTPVTATVSPATVAGTLSPATIQSTGSNFGNITLTGHTGSVVRWEKDDSGSWTTISNTTATQAYNSVTLPTDYRAVVKSGVCAEAYSAVTELCVMPAVPTTTGASRCGTGTVTLTAGTPPAGVELRWYAASSGGPVLTTGTSYVPSVSTTTTYYVSAANINGAAVCETSRTPVTATVSPATVGGTLSPATIQSIGSNSGTITLSGHTGSVVRWEKYEGSAWTTISNTTTTQAYNSVTLATDYRAVVKSGVCAEAYSALSEVCVMPTIPTVAGATRCGTGTVALTATPSGTATLRWYAASTGGSVLATTTSFTTPSITTTTTYYVSAVNINGAAVCESARVAVTAQVDAPSVGGTLTPPLVQDFENATGPLTLTGLTGQVVRWEQNTGSGWITISGTAALTTINYTGNEGSTQYRVAVKNGTCTEALSSVSTAEIFAVPVISFTETVIPYGGQVTASIATSYPQVQWYKDGTAISGATAQSLTIATPGRYGVQVTVTTPVVKTRTSIGLGQLVSNPGSSKPGSVGITIVKEKGVNTTDNLYALPVDKLAQAVSHTDGLGRVVQQIGIGQSPTGYDVVQAQRYNNVGEADKGYLPYTTGTRVGKARETALAGTNGAYMTSEQYLYYQQQTLVAHDTRPFSEVQYSADPMRRVLTQTAPGADWQTHPVVQDYRFNTTGEVRRWKPDGTCSDYYAANTLTVSILTDENGNQVRTFADKLGRTLLKQTQLDETVEGITTQWLETYYVYDVRGNLVYQVPPKAMAVLGPGASLTLANTSVTELIYKYTYDTQGRLTEKKVPGATEADYFVYDRFDQLVLTQATHQRALNQWTVSKHDQYGRVVYTGVYTDTVQTRADLQQAFDALTDADPHYELETADATWHGYTHQTFPNENLTLLSVAYYDHYDLDRNGTADYIFDATHLDALDEPVSDRTRGLSTASKTRIINSDGTPGAWITSVVFYDAYDRPLQTQSNNTVYAAAADRSTVRYNFQGQALVTKSTHHSSATESVAVVQATEYDHAGRALRLYHQVNSQPQQLAVQYDYNELGQVIDKKLHSTGAETFLQSVDYRYTIRGWLSSINNAQLTTDQNNDDTDDYFGMELLYQQHDAALGNTVAYNGNISAITWKQAGTGSGAEGQRGYAFAYDKTDRLRNAVFKANSTTGWNRELNTLNEHLTYDANGNVLSLVRHNRDTLAVPIVIDDLSYTYANGNQVSQVEDDGTTRGFANGEVAGEDEYAYNTAGQLTRDDNKGIEVITYNLLGKAQRVEFEDGRIVDYAYMATGTKVQMDVTQSSTTVTTQYVSGAVYENGTLQLLASPEGRLVKSGNSFEYQYAIADHQGNTRLVFSSAAPTPEETTATVEPVNETDERAHFLKYDDVRLVNAALFDHTNNGTTAHAVRLSGTEAETYGLVRSLQVGPGDKVKAEVFAKYVDPESTNWNAALTALMANVASAASGTVLDGEMYNTPEGSGIPFPGMGHGTQEGDAPKAYLSWLVFDNNFVPIPALSGYKRMTTAAKEGGTDVAHEKLEMAEITFDEAGYVYIYLSNEEGTPLEVYFDDFSVTHTKTNIVQYNEYYPYGMQTFASWTRDNSSNNFLYNAGSELNNTTNNYEMHFREYDPVLARMTAVDPMASKYASLTPYNYAFNDPVYFNDPSGAEPPGGWGIEHDPRGYQAPYWDYSQHRYEGGSIGSDTEMFNNWRIRTGNYDLMDEGSYVNNGSGYFEYSPINSDRVTRTEKMGLSDPAEWGWVEHADGSIHKIPTMEVYYLYEFDVQQNNGGGPGDPPKPQQAGISLEDLKKGPPTHPDFKSPKGGDRKVRNPNGRGTGWLDRNGDVWIPTDHNGTHAPHWERQQPGGDYENIYPFITSPSQQELLKWGAVVIGVGIIVFDIVTVPSGEGLIGVQLIRTAF